MCATTTTNNESSSSTVEIVPATSFEVSTPTTREAASNIALLRTLKYSNIEFIRYTIVDVCNTFRCKAVPLNRLLLLNDADATVSTKKKKSGAFESMVSIAEVCFAGLPSYADYMIPNTKLDARNVLTLQPDMSSLRILPYANKTAMVMCTAHDNNRTKQQSEGNRNTPLSPLCTRGLLSRVIQTAELTHGIGFNVGAEIEFNLYHLDPITKKFVPVDESIFANTTTLNEQEPFISDLYNQLALQDIEVELVHSESASGQLEVVLKYQTDPMVLADNVVLTRETIRMCARKHNMRAIFLPKVNAMQAGNGMHLHFSFRDLNSENPTENAFTSHDSDNGTDTLSAKGGAFMEGILNHLPGLTALTIPSVNSFRRVGVGCWTGSQVGWAIEDKEVPLRVCIDLETGNLRSVELKLSDSMSNIYLELALILSAGLDGIVRELELRPPMMNTAGGKGEEEEESTPAALPATFGEALNCLKKDKFLLGVMGEEMSTGYIALREAEIENSMKMLLEEEVELALRKA